MQDTVELDRCVCVALQDDVNLCLPAVKVSASLAIDVGQMDRCRQFWAIRKSASSGSAGTIDRWQFFELGDRWAVDHLGYRGSNGLYGGVEFKRRTSATKVFGFAKIAEMPLSQRKTREDIRVRQAWWRDWPVF